MQVGIEYITHTAMQLVCVKRDRFRCAGCMHSRDRSFTGGCAAPTDPEHRRVSCQPSCGQRDMHVRHQMLRRLK